MNSARYRIISLVPSWTETLIEAGALIVGRTRFCIHPTGKIKSIPSVGGTKNMNLEKILELKPDFVILDRQENNLEMAKQLEKENINLLISDVTSIISVTQFLEEWGQILKLPVFIEWSQRYRRLRSVDPILFWNEIALSGQHHKRPTTDRIDYVIWRRPWMAVGEGTFIAENLRLAGIKLARAEQYPEIEESDLRQSFCLFSSEPYPFAKDLAELLAQGFRGLLVDGEKLSWFGIRNLKFLERCSAEHS